MGESDRGCSPSLHPCRRNKYPAPDMEPSPHQESATCWFPLRTGSLKLCRRADRSTHRRRSSACLLIQSSRHSASSYRQTSAEPRETSAACKDLSSLVDRLEYLPALMMRRPPPESPSGLVDRDAALWQTFPCRPWGR